MVNIAGKHRGVELVTTDEKQEFIAYDLLPKRIRRVVMHMPMQVACASLYKQYKQMEADGHKTVVLENHFISALEQMSMTFVRSNQPLSLSTIPYKRLR
jgi:hypothetical protein